MGVISLKDATSCDTSNYSNVNLNLNDQNLLNINLYAPSLNQFAFHGQVLSNCRRTQLVIFLALFVFEHIYFFVAS